MKNIIIYTILVIIIVALVIFNVITVRRVSRRPEPAEPPSLNEYPVRVYGIVEPRGKETAVSPIEPGVIREIMVAEGDTVGGGDVLCSLENEVRLAAVEAALARVDLARKTAELSRDEYIRNRSLLADGSISESEYIRLKLKKERDERQVSFYLKELEQARARLRNLEVTAPGTGIVYLCDIREGEHFSSEGEARLILGSEKLQVRCDVEVLWIERLAREAVYSVLNAETGEPVGTARYLGSSRYLRSKRFTTEDPRERMSARYQEVIMDFNPDQKDVPVRLPVMVELKPQTE